MRKIVIFVTVLLMLSSAGGVPNENTIRVLVDESRVAHVSEYLQDYMSLFSFEDFDFRYSFHNSDEMWGFGIASMKIHGIASVNIKERGAIDYEILRDYDVLIIASFDEGYTPEEVDAIRRFVENGGGLLLLGHFEYPNNSVSRSYDVLFSSESVIIADEMSKNFGLYSHQFYVTDITPHPITEGVDKIALNLALPITSYRTGEALVRTSRTSWTDIYREEGVNEIDTDEKRGPFDILLAMEVGKGRAIFFGGAWSFFNWVVSDTGKGNLDLLRNMVRWLGEPGGPYTQSKLLNEQANELVSAVESLYGSHQFTRALAVGEEAVGLFEESKAIHPQAVDETGVETAREYIALCKTGIEADQIFGEALEFFDNQEYEKAIESFENAQSLYKKIGYTGRVTECSKKAEAVSLYQKGIDLLGKASHAFDSSDYEEAKSFFEHSKSVWEAYDDSSQEAACQGKIDQCTEEIDRIQQNRMLLIVGIVLSLFVIGILVSLAIYKSRTKLKEEESASKILERQFAKGVITEEELKEMEALLEE